MNASTRPAAELYRERAGEATTRERRAGALSLRLSWARFAAFLVFLIGGGVGVSQLGSGRLAAWIVCAAGLIALASFISFHERVLVRERAWGARRTVNERALSRFERRFDTLPAGTFPEEATARSTARDLNLFGPGSVAQWLGAVTTPAGRELLSRWLTETPDSIAEVVLRQEAVAELAPELDFRQEFEVAAMPLAATAATTARFVEWAGGEPFTERHPRLRLAGQVGRAVSLATLLLAALGLAPIHLWLLVLIANYAWTWTIRGLLETELDRLAVREGAFSAYAGLLRLASNRRFTAARLVGLRARLEASGLDPANELARLHRLVELSEVRRSSLHALLQSFLAWDLLLLERLCVWQRRAGRHAGDWLAASGELEVLAAFSGVRFDQPSWAFAELDPDADRLTASDLGHPLLSEAARVGNDVEVGPSSRLLLVTGSNMSGKSTLLRALGVNAILGQAGSPVCAAALRMPLLRVETSGRIDDSLLEGVSFFLAELRRLEEIVRLASPPRAKSARPEAPRLLFLLDEILRGTNSEERRIAVGRIVERLLDSGAIGAVSTHDLEIARVPELRERLHCVHLRETVEERPEGPAMQFDYRLREGLATTTNALVLLRLVGLDSLPDRPGT